MPRRGYVLAFVLVIVVLLGGALLGGWYLLHKFSSSGQVVATGVPQLLTSTSTPGIAANAVVSTPLALGLQPTLMATAIVTPPGPTMPPIPPLAEVLTPFVMPTPTFEPPATAVPVTPLVATEQVTVTPDLGGDFPFALARPLRNTVGGCGGNPLIEGLVTDRSGSPIPGVRLHLTDEFNSVRDTRPSKSEAVDLGRYDFPLFGPSRRYFVQVVDAAGRPISAVVEVDQGVGSDPGATCHEVDWQQH